MKRAFVLQYSAQKGFGFLRPLPPDAHLGDVFFHRTGIKNDGDSVLTRGQSVTFRLGRFNDRDVAIDVSVVGGAKESAPAVGSTNNDNN